jgi:hypothetical protein
MHVNRRFFDPLGFRIRAYGIGHRQHIGFGATVFIFSIAGACSGYSVSIYNLSV